MNNSVADNFKGMKLQTGGTTQNLLTPNCIEYVCFYKVI